MSADFWRRICHDIAAATPFHHEETPMSETLTTNATPVVNSTVTGIISTVESILPLLLAGKLAGLNTTLQGDLSTYDAAADAKLVELKTALDKLEVSNPMAQQIVSAVLSIVKATGMQLPSEAQVFLGLKLIVDTAFSLAKPAPTAS